MLKKHLTYLLAVISFCFSHLSLAQTSRVDRGLQVLYTFDDTGQNIVRDQSEVGTPVHLKIESPSTVKQLNGRLIISGNAKVFSTVVPKKVIDNVKRTHEITLETWVNPKVDRQKGPARIVSISKDPHSRNITLGQDESQYDLRLRTTKVSNNGIPSTATSSKTAQTKLSHVVYTRDQSGNAKLFLNGKQVTSKKISGDLSNWDNHFKLFIANEATFDREWFGEIHLVAIYITALSSKDVLQNFIAGPEAKLSPEELALRKKRQAEKHFEHKIAPLFAKHCIECHDSTTKEGGLVLSKRTKVFAGGENGKVIFPGKANESLLWNSVANNEMPHDRPPLSKQEKDDLKDWINNGAVWSLDYIDPVVYAFDSSDQQAWIQRLTTDEYIATVKATFQIDISKDAQRLLPKDLRADGFTNTAYNLGVDLSHVTAYEELSRRIVKKIDIGSFTRRFSSSRSLEDIPNRKLISSMGKWILRGPLENYELESYRGIVTTIASTGGNFDEAMGYVIQTMLQSPRFIYRIENQIGNDDRVKINQYELASRMSYILWGASPDETLFKLADEGKLNSKKVEFQVERMLQDSRSITRSKKFISEWLNLSRLDTLQPDKHLYPNWNPLLAKDMKEETFLFFEEVVWKQKRPLNDLLNADVTFLTPRLAKHYRLPFKDSGDGPIKVDLKSIPERGGLLTQGSVLTIGGDEGSMVSRGLFVLNDLLRGVVKAPPAGVDTTPVATKKGLTQRLIAQQRISNRNCGGCHGKFEPLAFALEKYDGLGVYRNNDHLGNNLREDGEVLLPGKSIAQKYSTAKELMDVLAKEDRVQETFTWKILQFSLGRPLTAADAKVVSQIHSKSQKSGGTYQSLMRSLILSELVLKTQ